MSIQDENNKRLAKNTAILYVRMLLTMAISIYTSRIVLSTLGISDYGIYNIVGGIITMLTYFNHIFAGGTSRFLTIALGKNDIELLKITFSTTIVLTLISAVFIVFLGETIGLWFVNTHLNIDPQRINATNWVFQCALLSTALTITQAPFSASIISHESMNVYAYMSIFDVAMKLLIVYILMMFDFDKLKLYAFLMFSVNIANILIYRSYCYRKFEECRLSFKFDKELFKKMMSYSGWNLVGILSTFMVNSGMNVVLNIFFGTIINAARGVAEQVNGIVRQLYSNFQTATRPQIMKYYAAGQVKEMQELICNSSKYCSFLLLCAIIPLTINIRGLLNIWLVEVPEYSVVFIRLTIIISFLSSMMEPLQMAIHSVGKVKLINLILFLTNFVIFGLTMLTFHCGGEPYICYIYLIMGAFVNLFSFLGILKKNIDFSIGRFLKLSIIPICYTGLASTIFPYLTYKLIPSTVVGCLTSCICGVVLVAFTIYTIGLPKNVREKIKIIVTQKIKYNNKRR